MKNAPDTSVSAVSGVIPAAASNPASVVFSGGSEG